MPSFAYAPSKGSKYEVAAAGVKVPKIILVVVAAAES